MHSSLKISAALLVNLSLLSHQVFAQLPPINFDTYDSVPVNLTSPDPWEPIYGNSSVTPAGQGFGGGKALKIAVDSDNEAWLRKPVDWNPAESIAFIDFRIKPAATPEGSEANFFANGTQIAFQVPYNSTTGQLWVLHGNDDAVPETPESPLPLEKWYLSAGTYTVPAESPVSTTWVRATLRHDYQRKIWDLFIDGKLAAVNLGFEGRGANLEHLEFYGSKAGDTLIDNLEANPSNMLFPDADKDGLPDAWEIANGSNSNLYDRDAIDQATGKSFLNKYLDSLWNAGSPGTPVNGSAGLGNVGTVPPLTILSSHQPVGALKGQFAVGGDGAATYTIPLDIPKGRAGMEPKLSLNYSSNAGNGPLGVGWSIGGLQKITRGPSSLKKDGIADGADFDENDRFYLDGERLVCIGGTYGKIGSEYRTEMDSFARIKALGLPGDLPSAPPAFWTVETKSGLTVTFGGKVDSKVEITGSGVFSWLVSEVADTTGRNSYQVDYCDNSELQAVATSSGRYPWRVRYTIDPTTSDNGFSSVNFDYEARPDVTYGYVRGVMQEANLRLRQVAVKTGTYLNHAYNFFYTTSEQTGRSLLYGVDKEAADGSRVPATSFQWETLSHSSPKWVEAGHLDFNEYGSGQDSGSDMASYVSVNSGGTELHLTGNAWRSYPIDNPTANPPTPYYNVTANTRLQFDYWSTAAPAVPKWGMIGLDENVSTANPKRLFKLIGTNGGIPPAACYSDTSGSDLNDYNYTTPGSWKTVNILVGQHYTGQMKYLALVNDDNSVGNNNGAGESRFRNIKIYEHLNANSAANAPVRIFDQAVASPRIIGGTNEDLGVRIQDLNADGLPDIAYNLLHSKSTGTGPVALQTFGQVLLNTGSGFVNDTTLLPGDTTLKLPSTIPTGNLPGAGEGQFANSQAIYPVPVDIDGDGRLDYSYAKNLTRDGNGYFTCEHGYLSSKSGVWADLPEYTHNFKSTCSTSQKRFSHFEHIDLDSDGDLDLVVHPYGASLALRTGVPNNPTHNPGGNTFPILGASGDNKGLAYLNRFDEGVGWEIAPEWRLPEPLKIPGFNSNGGEVGRGMQDLNGDGRPDIYSNLWPLPDEVWHNDPDSTYISPKTGSLSYWVPQPKVNPNSNPAVPPLTSLPEDVTNTSGQDIGTRLVDVNGDGHVDLLKALGQTIESINVGVHLNKGGVGWAKLLPPPATPLAPVPWQPEENFNTVDKRNEMKEQGTSFTDLNADGLVDFVVSKTTRNTVFFNTGSDWWPESIELENGTDVPNTFWVGDGPASGGTENGKWELPFRIYPNTVAATEGIRHAMLVDLNGDGVSDLIGDMKSPIPRIWINQAKPERIISFTDGFAASIQVDTYARLNDPTPVPNSLGLNRRVYDRTPVTSLLPGHVSLQDNRWVVARYSEPDGNGGRRYRSQYYGDLRYDRANEASLGFGKIEIHDELTRGKSVTQTRRDYPFAGSPDVSESFVYVTNGLPLHTDNISPGYHRVSQDTASYSELATTVGTGVPEDRSCSEIRRPVQTGSVSKKWDVDGTLMSEITTSQEFDAHGVGFGFVKKSTVKALDNTTTITENTYGNTIEPGKWWLGRLSMSVVKKRYAPLGPDVVVKTSTFAYNTTDAGPENLPPTGLLTRETVEPGDNLFVEKTYKHDAFGNITEASVKANTSATDSPQTRITSTEWDTTNHRFPTKETSTVGSVKFAYSQKRALLLSSTDLDDRKTTFTYDVFGTKLATNFPDHTRTAEITRFVTNADLPSSVAQKIGTATLRWARSAQASATPWSTVYFDTLGREIVTETVVMTAFDGTSATFANQYSVTLYDSRGRKHKTSTPFLAEDGEEVYWTEVFYDDLDRPVKTIRPDGEDEGVLKYGPADLGSGPVSWVKTYNAKNHELQRWTDQHDRLVQSSDESDRATTFDHDIEGRLTSVFIASECQLRNRWDKMGNKVAVWDMSSGGSDPGASFSDPNATLPNPASYHYSTSVPNGFGEVRSSTTPHGTITTQYDSAGRVWKVVREGTTYTTTYRGDAPGKGKPESVDSTGIINGYQEFLVYGSDLGKPHEYGKLIETKKRQSGPEALYISRTKYNAVGLVMDEFFDGTAGTDDDAHVRHEYDSEYGSYKVRTKLFDDATQISTVLSEFVSVERSGSEIVSKENLTHAVLRETRNDARTGRIKRILSTRGGGSEILQDLAYTWDPNGNLESRTDMKAGTAGKTESFSTDHLDRLTSSTISGESTIPYTYDQGDKGNLIAKNGNTFNYSGYRVTSATIKGQSRIYSYDNAGHVINDGKREYEWTSFGQLKSVEQDSCPAMETFAATNTYATAIPGIALRAIYAASHARSEFQFDAAGSRSQQTLVRSFNDGSAARVITRYVGSYQVEEHASQPVSGSYTTVRNLHRHQLGSSLLTRDHKTSAHPDGPSSTLRLALVLTDHIGSTDVIVRADWTGSAWNVASGAPKAERQSFDAWGQRRDGTGWSDLHPASGSTRKTSAMDEDRGFTGHEMLDDFGIVHMNGRIYDSELGRFLSPDPYVQVPEYSQNFNRYSYVLNNPLSLTDPSGNLIHGLHVAGLLEVREAGQRYLQSQPEVAQVVMIVVAVALWWTGAGIWGAGAWQTGAFVGGTTGAIRADINGGSAGDILRGAAVGAVQGAITTGVLHGFGASAAETATQAGTLITGSLAADRAINIAGHAVLGGLSNAALGGKFQDGFLSGLAGAAVAATGVYDLVKGDGYGAVAARTAMAGIVGGTASAIGGGKFANGAWTAAFQFLLSSAAESLNTERLVGRFQQELTGSCVAASCRNAIEAMGGNPPSEERIRSIFDEEAPLPINWSVGCYPKDAPAVLARLGYQATYQRTSLNGLLKLTKPAILEITWPNGSGHAVLLESSSYKRFLFIFKYDRRYNIVDPGIRGDRSIKPSAKEYSASELKSDYYGYGGKYTKRSVVFD